MLPVSSSGVTKVEAAVVSVVVVEALDTLKEASMCLFEYLLLPSTPVLSLCDSDWGWGCDCVVSSPSK